MKLNFGYFGSFSLVLFLTLTIPLDAADPIQNPAINYPEFQRLTSEVGPLRELRRLTEAQFLALAARPDTVVLDARSADKFALRHIRGAVNLPFTDFTEESLARVIPNRNTRVLIYCNNNFVGARESLANKAPPASLNLSTWVSLAAYGYRNVYELGPLLDVAATRLPFAGTEVSGEATKRAESGAE